MPVFGGPLVLEAPPPLAVEAFEVFPQVIRNPATPKTVIWDAANGDRLVLTDYSAGYGQDWGRSGFGAPPVEIRADDLASGGTRVRDQRYLPRNLSWVQHVLGDDQADTDAKWSRLIAAMRHRVGAQLTPGRLTVVMFDGRARYIDCWYKEGLELEETAATFSPGHASAPLRVEAPDPFFTAVDEIIATLQVVDQTPGFYSDAGFYPLQVAPSQLAGATTLVNPGDQDVRPIIEITGPAINPVVRNSTLGQQFVFTRTIPAGLTVTVDTKLKTVLASDGTNWRQYLTYPGSAFWSLVQGDNNLAVTMTGVSVASRVTFRFRPRYDNP